MIWYGCILYLGGIPFENRLLIVLSCFSLFTTMQCSFQIVNNKASLPLTVAIQGAKQNCIHHFVLSYLQLPFMWSILHIAMMIRIYWIFSKDADGNDECHLNDDVTIIMHPSMLLYSSLQFLNTNRLCNYQIPAVTLLLLLNSSCDERGWQKKHVLCPYAKCPPPSLSPSLPLLPLWCNLISPRPPPRPRVSWVLVCIWRTTHIRGEFSGEMSQGSAP